MIITKASEAKLSGVHPDLIRVYRRFVAASKLKYTVIVTCGLRTLAEQKKNIAKGVSQTMRSRHIRESNRSRYAEAIDLAPIDGGKMRWDWPYFHQIADEMKTAADFCSVPIVWGGDWKTFKDGPHFELDRKEYPA